MTRPAATAGPPQGGRLIAITEAELDAMHGLAPRIPGTVRAPIHPHNRASQTPRRH